MGTVSFQVGSITTRPRSRPSTLRRDHLLRGDRARREQDRLMELVETRLRRSCAAARLYTHTRQRDSVSVHAENRVPAVACARACCTEHPPGASRFPTSSISRSCSSTARSPRSQVITSKVLRRERGRVRDRADLERHSAHGITLSRVRHRLLVVCQARGRSRPTPPSGRCRSLPPLARFQHPFPRRRRARTHTGGSVVDHWKVLGPRHAPLAGPLDQPDLGRPLTHGQQIAGRPAHLARRGTCSIAHGTRQPSLGSGMSATPSRPRPPGRPSATRVLAAEGRQLLPAPAQHAQRTAKTCALVFFFTPSCYWCSACGRTRSRTARCGSPSLGDGWCSSPGCRWAGDHLPFRESGVQSWSHQRGRVRRPARRGPPFPAVTLDIPGRRPEDSPRPPTSSRQGRLAVLRPGVRARCEPLMDVAR